MPNDQPRTTNDNLRFAHNPSRHTGSGTPGWITGYTCSIKNHLNVATQNDSFCIRPANAGNSLCLTFSLRLEQVLCRLGAADYVNAISAFRYAGPGRTGAWRSRAACARIIADERMGFHSEQPSLRGTPRAAAVVRGERSDIAGGGMRAVC